MSIAEGNLPRVYDLLVEANAAKCRKSFYFFRTYIHDDLIDGWWQRIVASEFQLFYERVKAGLRPKLVLMSPPQHGKSVQAIDFLAWLAGINPNLQTIFASYGEDLGIKANHELQRIIASERYQKIFPFTKLSDFGDPIWPRNSFLLQFVRQRGSFRNVTVNSGVTGQSLDIGVVDDPMKGRAEANSELIRNKTWHWFTNDYFTRFSDKAGLLIIATRWHIDDPLGRFIETFNDDVRLVRYPAIATRDERHRKKGEALFPEFKTLDFLLERKKALSQGSWEALYQQNPIIIGGGIFPIDKFGRTSLVDPKSIKASMRSWDKAGTEDGGAYTAGVLMHELHNGMFIIADVRRGQWSALEREKIILQTAKLDGYRVQILVEQEPGSGGKESIEATVRLLRGFRVSGDRVTGDKVVRADGYAAQVQGGNVAIVRAEWNQSFLDEHEAFPNAPYKDQVDACTAAFNKLTGSLYDSSLAWVRGVGIRG